MTKPKDFLLIGTSDNFADRALLKRKLDLYLKDTPESPVIALNDVGGLLREYFGDRLIDSLSPSMSMREKRQLVQASKWAVYFWDGTGLTDFVYFSSLLRRNAKTVFVPTCRVVNKDRGDEFDVYIGRGTPWGNPFPIEKGVDRAEVLRHYEEYFTKKFIEDPQGNRDIRTLRGMVLGCHCKPARCHGDIIAKYLNALDSPVRCDDLRSSNEGGRGN